YHQAIYLQTNIRNNSGTFKSDSGTSGPMPNAVSGATTFPVAPRDSVVELTISAFFATVDGKLGAKDIRDPKYASSKVDVHESRKPEGASEDIPDYVTYFIFVEDTSDADQVAGSGQFDDSVVTVHLVKTNTNPIPPPPPPDVVKPYNPVLDRPRPSKLPNYLKEYDVIFLIDDSGSMKGDRWREATQALNNLSNYIIENGWDSDGIDLRFLNSNTIFKFRDELVNGVEDKDKVAQAIGKVQPDGGTPTGRRVRELLDIHVGKLEQAKGTEAYSQIKPLDLICITDGEPTDDAAHEVGKMLVEVANKLRTKPPHHPNSLGIQFVQIGGDEKAKEALTKLTQLDTGNIVDTVPYNGPGSITAERLERILLGALHPNIRAMRAP
ncbi:hypothetical protein E4U19_000139, partial [Claviceps sp. Clav32 group G5]